MKETMAKVSKTKTWFPVDYLEDGHSEWCEVIPYCSFDLHLSDNY